MESLSKGTVSLSQPVLLTPDVVKPRLHKLLILDVQNPKYATSTIPKARRLNVDILLKDIPKTQPILLTCLDGRLSFAAAKQLLKSGFRPVYVLKGGVLGWRQAGYTVQRISYSA
ncbi:MAG: rhodanese-like domain-containing protein [Oculatellaceae cyanobacterium Prado106]|nr:rhodanese-like domain-containing protein [Oculatellaceae cyanobacterium Prado106]